MYQIESDLCMRLPSGDFSIEGGSRNTGEVIHRREKYEVQTIKEVHISNAGSDYGNDRSKHGIIS